MDLIERYLAAIRRGLPQDRADDIVAELRDDILTRIEAREEGLGRPLEKPELEAVVREFGRPVMVAARYREHQYLIGPEIFPFYLQALRVVMSLVVLITVVLAGVDMALGSGDMIQAALHAVSGIVGTALTAFAVVTLGFAVVERRCHARAEQLDWNLDELPSLDELVKDSRRDAPIEIVAGALFLAWWLGAIPFPPAGWNQFHMALAPIWHELYWPIAALLAGRLVMSILSLMPHRLAPLRYVLAVATTIGGLVLVYLLFQAGHWVEIVPGSIDPEQAVKLEESINLAVRITLVVSAIMWTIGGFGTALRWWRRGKRG